MQLPYRLDSHLEVFPAWTSITHSTSSHYPLAPSRKGHDCYLNSAALHSIGCLQACVWSCVMAFQGQCSNNCLGKWLIYRVRLRAGTRLVPVHDPSSRWRCQKYPPYPSSSEIGSEKRTRAFVHCLLETSQDINLPLSFSPR